MRGALLLALLCGACSYLPAPARPAPLPFEERDVNDVARLLLLEDRRQFDETALGNIAQSTHPEVRRRAIQAIARIPHPRGSVLLARARSDRDTAVFATVVFATGQIRDSSAVPWLRALLTSPETYPHAAVEAARALGKIRTPAAHEALSRFLSDAAQPSPAVGEALLAIGRFTTRADLTPILRWTTARDDALRWRATWALFRPRDPAAIERLLVLASDRSPDVRYWAVRALTPPQVDSAGVPRERAVERLTRALRDDDRRVRTEALRTLGWYDDDAATATVIAALDARDSWLSVSAAEALGRHSTRAEQVLPPLIAATAAGRPLALRVTALNSIAALSTDAALEAAVALARDSSVFARTQALVTLGRLGDAGRARADSLVAADPQLAAQRPGQPPPPRAPLPAYTPEDYRRLVQSWILPAYQGAALPRVVLETTRGTIEVELHSGDAPFGVEHMRRVIESGDIIGTEFTRVVPNFVVQQRAIRGDITLRDEVGRRALTRGTLSWASSGLDTGRPGYTLGTAPQPHNEGDFTALGRVVRGMDVVDRIELGDRIIGARLLLRE